MENRIQTQINELQEVLGATKLLMEKVTNSDLTKDCEFQKQLEVFQKQAVDQIKYMENLIS